MAAITTLLGMLIVVQPAPDLVAMARAGPPPSFAMVLDARFDPAGTARFDALSASALKVSREERARYYDALPPGPDGKPHWHERKACGRPDRVGLVRAMIVAAGHSADRAAAQRLWAEVEHAYATAEMLERKNLAAAALEVPHRPTEVGKALVARVGRDQAWREAQSDRAHDDVTDEAIGARFWSRECHIDDDNTTYLKDVVAHGNWPIISRDGAAAASDAWVLAQHADDDPAFQEEVLAIMAPLVARKEAEGKNYALMFDRVATARHRLQRYGTQFGPGKGGCMAVLPVEDHAGLDARRAAMGLPTLADYAKHLAAAYHKTACADLFDPAQTVP